MSPQRSANITSAVIFILLAVLQGTVHQQAVGQRAVKYTCSHTCSGNCYYRWYRGKVDQQRPGNYLGCSSTATVWIDSTSSSNQDGYSCMVNNYTQHPPDCELGEKHWGVTYTPDRVCALEGSSVDLSCSYKHPEGFTVNKSLWFIHEQRGVEPVDLREDDQYKGRVQYYQNQTQLYHTLKITGLRVSDSQTYKFRFITDNPDGKYTGSSGVSLSVTGLKIEVSDTQGEGKWLNCSSTCTLTNPTYIWYRNGQSVPEQNGAVLYLKDRTVDAGSYSCAVKGHEEIRSAAVYSPKDTRAVVLPSGERKEGDSVTLTCSSDANPPVLNINWFKQSVNESLGTGQNYSITSISSQHSGLYYCTALNQLGQHSSAPTRLDVFYKTSAIYVASGVLVVLLLIFITVLLCMRRKSALSRSRCEESTGGTASAPVYETISDLAMTSGPCTGAASSDEFQYSTIEFKQFRPQEEPLCPTVHQTRAFNKEEEVEYATVNKGRAGTARCCRNEESPIYSMIHNST